MENENYLNDIRNYNTRQARPQRGNEPLRLSTCRITSLKNLAFAVAHILDTESLCRYLEGI